MLGLQTVLLKSLPKLTFVVSKLTRNNISGPLLSSRCSIFHSVKDIYLSTDVDGHGAQIKGWVKAVRKMKENLFVDIDDGSCPGKLQVVIPKSTAPKNLTYGSAVEVSGKLVPNQNIKFELVTEDIKVVGSCDVTDGFPFVPRKSYHPDYVRQFLHFRPRTKSFSSLLRVRHCASQAVCKYFNESGFIKIDVPLLTSNDCEGAGEVFSVKPGNNELIKEMTSEALEYSPEEVFFNGKTYLTVSGQLHLEVAARALGKVYCKGPTFRAENSKSRLHLAEFYMVEAELAFTKSLDDILRVMENLVKSTTESLLNDCSEDIHSYVRIQNGEKSVNLDHLLKFPYTVDSYDKVCTILENHSDKFGVPFKRGQALSKDHEFFLVTHNNNVPIFVVDWPTNIKPFYMKAHPDIPTQVQAVDLLCPNVGELCGGSLREDEFHTLQTKLQNANLDEKLLWYLELRKFGNVPTGGFGMGFERYLQVVLGIPNIKDAIPFPRYPHNCQL